MGFLGKSSQLSGFPNNSSYNCFSVFHLENVYGKKTRVKSGHFLEHEQFSFSVLILDHTTDLHSCPKYQTDSVQLLSVLCVEWLL